MDDKIRRDIDALIHEAEERKNENPIYSLILCRMATEAIVFNAHLALIEKGEPSTKITLGDIHNKKLGLSDFFTRLDMTSIDYIASITNPYAHYQYEPETIASSDIVDRVIEEIKRLMPNLDEQKTSNEVHPKTQIMKQWMRKINERKKNVEQFRQDFYERLAEVSLPVPEIEIWDTVTDTEWTIKKIKNSEDWIKRRKEIELFRGQGNEPNDEYFEMLTELSILSSTQPEDWRAKMEIEITEFMETLPSEIFDLFSDTKKIEEKGGFWFRTKKRQLQCPNCKRTGPTNRSSTKKQNEWKKRHAKCYDKIIKEYAESIVKISDEQGIFWFVRDGIRQILLKIYNHETKQFNLVTKRNIIKNSISNISDFNGFHNEIFWDFLFEWKNSEEDKQDGFGLVHEWNFMQL